MFFGIVLVRIWFTTGYFIIRCWHGGQNLSAMGSTDCIHPGNHEVSGAPLGLSQEQTLLLPDCELLEMSLCGSGGCMLRASRTEQPQGRPNLYHVKPLDSTALRWRLRWCADTLVCTKPCNNCLSICAVTRFPGSAPGAVISSYKALGYVQSPGQFTPFFP